MSDFFIPPTHHLEGLEDMAVRLEQEGKFETALETYRQALAREGNMTDRGRRFETKIAELEARLRRSSVDKPAPWWQGGLVKGLLIGVVVMLGLFLIVSWLRPNQQQADPVVPPLQLPSSSPSPIAKETPSPAATPDQTPTPRPVHTADAGDPIELVKLNYKFLAKGDYHTAETLRSKKCLAQEASLGGLRAIYHNAKKVPTHIENAEVASAGEARYTVHARVAYEDDGKTYNMEFIFEKENGKWKIAEIPHKI